MVEENDFELVFFHLEQELRKLGWEGIPPAARSLFIGGTGGVRTQLENGKISQDTLDKFNAALKERFGAGADFQVLNPEDEADFERRAAQ